MSTAALKKQTKTKADVIIDFGTWNSHMMDCNVFANTDDENTIIVMFQDKNNPERKVQISLNKDVLSPPKE